MELGDCLLFLILALFNSFQSPSTILHYKLKASFVLCRLLEQTLCVIKGQNPQSLENTTNPKSTFALAIKYNYSC